MNSSTQNPPLPTKKILLEDAREDTRRLADLINKLIDKSRNPYALFTMKILVHRAQKYLELWQPENQQEQELEKIFKQNIQMLQDYVIHMIAITPEPDNGLRDTKPWDAGWSGRDDNGIIKD